MKYSIETRRKCSCGREVDAVRERGKDAMDLLLISRHLSSSGIGFCPGSLGPAPETRR